MLIYFLGLSDVKAMGYRLKLTTAILWSSIALIATGVRAGEVSSAESTQVTYCANCESTQARTVQTQACEQTFVALGCKQFLEDHPDAKDKLNYCPKTNDGAGSGRKLLDIVKGCAKGGRDLAVDTWQFLKMLANPMPLDDETLAREKLFRECESTECKRNMLGHFAFLFTDLEIGGHGDKDPKIDCRDVVNKNYCYGYSAAVLYRLMLQRATPLFDNHTLDDEWIAPWSTTGEPEKIKHFHSIKNLFYDTLGVRYECYNRENQANLTCYIIATVIGPKFAKAVGGAALKAAARLPLVEIATADIGELVRGIDFEALDAGVDENPHYSGHSGELSEPREKFSKEFRGLDGEPFKWPSGIKADNKLFISKIEKAVPKENQLVFSIDNASQKELNSVLGRKDYVDALNNKMKEIMLKKISNIKRAYPNIEITGYSDYKSVKLLIETADKKLPPGLAEYLQKSYAEAVSDLDQFLKSEKLIYATDKPKLWFRAGLGQTEMRANMAARHARAFGDAPQALVFENEKVEKLVRENIKASEVDRAGLLKNHPQLFEDVNGMSVMRSSAFEVARKTKNLAEIRNILTQRFDLKQFSLDDAKLFHDYSQRLNQFSPSVLATQREVASLSNATFGGISIDLVGQGAENLRATAMGLQSVVRAAKGKVDKVETEIFETTLRRQDMIATSVFEGRKEEITSVARSSLARATRVKASGDDIVADPRYPLDEDDQARIFKKLAESTRAPFRASYVSNTGVQKGVVDAVAGWADKQMANLRSDLEGIVPEKKLRAMVITSSVADGQIRFRYFYQTRDKALELTELEAQRVQAFMQRRAKENQFVLDKKPSK